MCWLIVVGALFTPKNLLQRDLCENLDSILTALLNYKVEVSLSVKNGWTGFNGQIYRCILTCWNISLWEFTVEFMNL